MRRVLAEASFKQVLPLALVRTRSELTVTSRHSRHLRRKYGPAWRYVAPIPEPQKDVIEAAAPSPPAGLVSSLGQAMSDAARSSAELKPLPSSVVSTIRTCFHMLIRSRLVEAAVSLYHRLLDLGIQLQRSDLTVLMWNLPYDKSTTVAGSDAPEWASGPRSSRKRKSQAPQSSGSRAPSDPVNDVHHASGEQGSAALTDHSQQRTDETPGRLVSSEDRPLWLKRWIEVEIALGNLDLFDDRFSHKKVVARPFRESCGSHVDPLVPDMDKGSNVLDCNDAALVNTTHRSFSDAEFADMQSPEPLPLIEHLAYLQANYKQPSNQAAHRRCLSDPNEMSFWSEALHLASIYVKSQRPVAAPSPRLLQACANAALCSSSWKVQQVFLAMCAKNRPAQKSVPDETELEVSSKLLANVALSMRQRRTFSKNYLRDISSLCAKPQSECLQNALIAIGTLARLEHDCRSSRRQINVRQLLEDCMATVKVMASHLFIDASRLVDAEKRRSAVAVSIQRGLYSPANVRRPSQDVANELPANIRTPRSLASMFELVCGVVGLVANLLPSIALLPMAGGATPDSAPADQLVRDLFFSSFGLVESHRVLSNAMKQLQVDPTGRALSSAIGSCLAEGLTPSPRARATPLSASSTLQLVQQLHALSTAGTKTQFSVAKLAARCVVLGGPVARSAVRTRSEVGKRMILEGLALLQQSGHWESLPFRQRSALRMLWHSQVGRAVRESLTSSEAKRLDMMIALASWRRESSRHEAQSGFKKRRLVADKIVLAPERMTTLLERCLELSSIRSTLGSSSFIPTLQAEMDGSAWDKALRILAYIVQNARIRPRTIPLSLFASSLRALRTPLRNTWLDAVQVFWVATDFAALPDRGSQLLGSPRPEHVVLDALLAAVVKTLVSARHTEQARDVIKVWERVVSNRTGGKIAGSEVQRKQFFAFAAVDSAEALRLGLALHDEGAVDGSVSEEFQRVAVHVAKHHWLYALNMLTRFCRSEKPTAGIVRAALRILRECPSNLDRQALALYNGRADENWNNSCT